MPRTDTAADILRAVEFDHPFAVTAAGTITDAPAGIYAPECYHDETSDITLAGAEDTWEALTGYTGQYSYSGAVMHSSEYLGGRIASDILETPGVYVVVVVEVLPEWRAADPSEAAAYLAGHVDGTDYRETSEGLEVYDEYPEPAGWAVLRHRTAGQP